ncbi:hypothetical protein B566_EDAN013451 [Ephemera danica]|nr:hypothetical protein B566_EDAN013451 [Ephemera danica]
MATLDGIVESDHGIANRSEAGNNTSTENDDSMEYDYDYEANDVFFWNELIPILIVYGLTLVLGVVGNSLIVFTIVRYRRMKSATNVFLASLASADLLLIIICIPVKCTSDELTNLYKLTGLAKLFSYSWTMGLFLCKLVHYIQNVSAISSVLTLTAMSTERILNSEPQFVRCVSDVDTENHKSFTSPKFVINGATAVEHNTKTLPSSILKQHHYRAYYAIVHPMRAKYTCTIRQASRIILGTWIASLLLSIPILFVQAIIQAVSRFSIRRAREKVHMSVGERIKAHWCVRNWYAPTLWRAYEVYMLLLLLIVPAAIMGATYSAIGCEVWRVMQRRQGMTSGQG